MSDDLRSRILAAVRETRIKLGTNALEIAQRGGTFYLTPEEAGGIADAAMSILEDFVPDDLDQYVREQARLDPAFAAEYVKARDSAQLAAKWHAAYEAFDCGYCAVEERQHSYLFLSGRYELWAYSRLVAETRFGHDAVAHRLYKGLIDQGVATAEQVAALTDDQVYDLRNSGRQSLERVRSRFPRPTHDTAIGGDGE